MRAISGADSDAWGAGAEVHHATSPTLRDLSATRSIAGSGTRRDFPFSHINDAEIKLFEEIIQRLPTGAKGTIHFSTMRVRTVDGHTVWEPYPACSACIRASFEAAGRLRGVDLVSHAPVHPSGGVEFGEHPARPGASDKPVASGKPGAVGGEPATEPALPGSSTGRAKGVGGTASSVAAEVGPLNGPTMKGPLPTTPQPGRFTGLAVGVGSAAFSIGIGLLSSYLKARVDRKIAAAQIDRNQARAAQVINQQLDTILGMMLTAPESTLYARVYMSSAVITTYDFSSIEPSTTDSSPMIDLTGVGFTFAKLDPSLADTQQYVTGGGFHSTSVRLLVSEIPLETPPIENLIALAKARGLPLDRIHDYILGRFAGIDQHEAPGRLSADVKRWQHLLDLVAPSAARP
jgi:hypothetical protein